MWAPVCRLWRTLDTCQNPGPRRCGVTSSRMLVDGGLRVRSSTVTDRSMYRLMASFPASGQVGDGAPGSRQLDDVEASVRPVHEVDEPPVVHLDIVRLDGYLAPLGAGGGHAALVGARRRGRDVVARLLRIEGVADVHRPHARVEVRDEDELAVVDRRERLAAGMRTEASAAMAEVAGRRRHLVRRDGEGL